MYVLHVRIYASLNTVLINFVVTTLTSTEVYFQVAFPLKVPLYLIRGISSLLHALVGSSSMILV